MFGNLFKKKVVKPANMVVVTELEHKQMHSRKCATCICLGCSRACSCRCQLCDNSTEVKLFCEEKVGTHK